MKITINIKDSKVAFFIELLQNFDFISIEKTQDLDNTNISEEHKKILDQRLASYKSDSNNLLDWKDVKKDIQKGLQ